MKEEKMDLQYTWRLWLYDKGNGFTSCILSCIRICFAGEYANPFSAHVSTLLSKPEQEMSAPLLSSSLLIKLYQVAEHLHTFWENVSVPF